MIILIMQLLAAILEIQKNKYENNEVIIVDVGLIIMHNDTD